MAGRVTGGLQQRRIPRAWPQTAPDNYLPLQVDFSTSLLVEVESTAAELADDAPLIVTLLQLYANHLRLLDYAEKTR